MPSLDGFQDKPHAVPPASKANHDAPVVENSVPHVDAHGSKARVQGTRFHFLTRFERRTPTVFFLRPFCLSTSSSLSCHV